MVLALLVVVAIAAPAMAQPRLDPPNAPDSIGGPDYAILDQVTFFTVTATDPDSDSVYVILYPDMNDTTRQFVFGPTASGVPVTCTTAYTANATYTLQARAWDLGGLTSPLSPPKTVDVGPVRIAWRYQTVDGDAFYSSPAVGVSLGGDTVVYVGCDNAKVYAFDAATGALMGSFSSFNEDAFSATPAVSSGQSFIYVADDGGWLYCLSVPYLRLVSNYPPNDTWIPGMTPFYSSPAVYENHLYLGRDDGYFYLFNNFEGQLIFRAAWNTSADISSSPGVSLLGHRIVVANDSGYVCGFDDTLALMWSSRLDSEIISSPALAPDGIFYVGCSDGKLYSLRLSNGSQAFPAFTAEGRIVGSPVVGPDSTVYFGTDTGLVYAVKFGTERWHTRLPRGERLSATPCLAADSTLLVNTNYGTVYALDLRPARAGRVLYRIVWPPPFRTGGHKSFALASSPTVAAGTGLFFAGSPNGGFFAVQVDRPGFRDGLLPGAPWPKFRHDIENRGSLAPPSGITETPPRLLPVSDRSAAVVSRVLRVPPSPTPGSDSRIRLFNISGRSVLQLHPGENDVSRIAPGVYFVGPNAAGHLSRTVIVR
jgi:outer membrane protein assembly factor BamB